MTKPSLEDSEERKDGHLEQAKTIDIHEKGSATIFHGMSLDDVLPDLGKPWWKVPHLLKLNLVLLGDLLTPATNGFDGSMMNGLQPLPVWQKGKSANQEPWLSPVL